MPSFKQAEPKGCGPRAEVSLQGRLWLRHSCLFQLQRFSQAFIVEETPVFPFPSGSDELLPVCHKLPGSYKGSGYFACISRVCTSTWLSLFYSMLFSSSLSAASVKVHAPVSGPAPPLHLHECLTFLPDLVSHFSFPCRSATHHCLFAGCFNTSS